jgi:HEAT repeat protein
LESSALSSSPELLDTLISTLGDVDVYHADMDWYGYYDSVIKLFIKIGVNAIPFLIEALGDQKVAVSAKSSIALAGIGSNAVPALIQALKNTDTEVRRRAAFVLGEIGSDAIPALLLALQNEDHYIRHGAIYAIGIINKQSLELVNTFKDIIEDTGENIDERRVAASVLALMGQDVDEFFRKNNLVSPKNAIFPINIKHKTNNNKAKFDIYTGRCLMSSESAPWDAAQQGGWASIIDGLKRFFTKRG